MTTRAAWSRKAYGRDILTGEEWSRVKVFLRESLSFLSSLHSSSTDTAEGDVVIDPDADLRNADWLRIDAAHLRPQDDGPNQRIPCVNSWIC